jgi:Smg protein
MFEVLVYMFENYFEVNVRPDHGTLARELFAAGFEQEDINGAFDWFTVLEEMAAQPNLALTGQAQGLRIYAEIETKKISTESLGFLMFLEQAHIINPAQREVVIDRAMALPQLEVDIEETRWIVLMALWNQDKANDYLFVEDAVFGEDISTLH